MMGELPKSLTSVLNDFVRYLKFACNRHLNRNGIMIIAALDTKLVSSQNDRRPRG